MTPNNFPLNKCRSYKTAQKVQNGSKGGVLLVEVIKLGSYLFWRAALHRTSTCTKAWSGLSHAPTWGRISTVEETTLIIISWCHLYRSPILCQVWSSFMKTTVQLQNGFYGDSMLLLCHFAVTQLRFLKVSAGFTVGFISNPSNLFSVLMWFGGWGL